MNRYYNLFLLSITSIIFSCQSPNIITFNTPITIQTEKELISSYFNTTDYKKENQEAIAAIDTGEKKIASAAWWGFNKLDATEALQNALNSKASVVVVPFMHNPWYIRPVFLTSNKKIIFEEGVVVKALAGAFLDINAHLFKAVGIENVELRGYGAKLEMQKNDYSKSPYEPSSYRHCIGLYGVRNFKIFGLEITNSGGDGVYIRGAKTLPYSENVHIKDANLSHHTRQGISIISAQNLFIEHTRLANTNGRPPQAGIDFEPNHSYERLVRCLIRNCEIMNNSGVGILMYLKNLTAQSEPVSITAESNFIRNNFIFSTWIDGTRNKVQGEAIFANNNLSPFKNVNDTSSFLVRFQDESLTSTPPVADAGGPYTINFAGKIRLNGMNSRETDKIGGLIDWHWDLNADGIFGDVIWDNPEITWDYLVNGLNLEPGKSYPIRLKVRDDDYEWSEVAETTLYLDLLVTTN